MTTKYTLETALSALNDLRDSIGDQPLYVAITPSAYKFPNREIAKPFLSSTSSHYVGMFACPYEARKATIEHIDETRKTQTFSSYFTPSAEDALKNKIHAAIEENNTNKVIRLTKDITDQSFQRFIERWLRLTNAQQSLN